MADERTRTRATRRVLWSTSLLLMLALLGAACGGSPPSDDGGAAAPGSGVTPRTVNFGSILPVVSETGLVTLSQDGLGTNAEAGGTVTIEKPAGATVRRAFVAAASVPTAPPIADGAVTVQGVPIAWDVTTPNAIDGDNYWAEVTDEMAPILDAAPAGAVELTVVESNPLAVDGVIVTVIFDDPNRTVANTIALLFGAQNVGEEGDDFNIGLAEPIDTSDPELGLEFGLGISFGAAGVQFSTVDVNGQRLSSAAGGYDDGELANGALLTVGGTGDTPDNPPDPNAPPAVPDFDDELYDLVPFVSDGDTEIAVSTANPSTDDNIFFASLVLNSTVAVVGEGITLTPIDTTLAVGAEHTVTAAVQDAQGAPIAGRDVTFEVIEGPNTGQTQVVATDAAGNAQFSYSSAAAGVDQIRASFVNSADEVQLSNVVRVEWTGEGDGTPVANDQTVTTAADTPVSFVLDATDPDGDPLTFTIDTPPTNGALSGTAPNLTYTPAAGFTGTDTFSYTAADETGSDTATVTIQVDGAQNAPPEAVDDTASTTPDTPVAVAVLDNDSDPDGDPLTVASATDGANGTTVVNPDGTVTYTPAAGFSGVDTFTYTIEDGQGGSDTATVTVTVAEDEVEAAVRWIKGHGKVDGAKVSVQLRQRDPQDPRGVVKATGERSSRQHHASRSRHDDRCDDDRRHDDRREELRRRGGDDRDDRRGKDHRRGDDCREDCRGGDRWYDRDGKHRDDRRRGGDRRDDRWDDRRGGDCRDECRDDRHRGGHPWFEVLVSEQHRSDDHRRGDDRRRDDHRRRDDDRRRHDRRCEDRTISFVSTSVDELDVDGDTGTASGSGKVNGRSGYTWELTVQDRNDERRTTWRSQRRHHGHDAVELIVRDARGRVVLEVDGKADRRDFRVGERLLARTPDFR